MCSKVRAGRFGKEDEKTRVEAITVALWLPRRPQGNERLLIAMCFSFPLVFSKGCIQTLDFNYRAI